jgi:uncharacterized protein with HEPN domain
MLRDRAYMLDILEAAKLAVTYVVNKEADTFIKDIQCQDAVIRRLEIIGEADGRISNETRADYPNIPWREIIGMRNILIHEYDDIDLDTVFKTAKKDMPLLIASIKQIMNA